MLRPYRLRRLTTLHSFDIFLSRLSHFIFFSFFFFSHPSQSFSCGCSSSLKPRLHLSGSPCLFNARPVTQTSPPTCFHPRTPTLALNHFSAHVSLLLSSHLRLLNLPSLSLSVSRPVFTPLRLYELQVSVRPSAGGAELRRPGQRERAGPAAVKPVILPSPPSGMCGEWRGDLEPAVL